MKRELRRHLTSFHTLDGILRLARCYHAFDTLTAERKAGAVKQEVAPLGWRALQGLPGGARLRSPPEPSAEPASQPRGARGPWSLSCPSVLRLGTGAVEVVSLRAQGSGMTTVQGSGLLLLGFLFGLHH